MDWQLNPRHRLSVRYNHQNFTGGNNENSGVTNSLEHTGDSLVRTRTVNASLSSVFRSTLFNEVRFQYAQDQEPGESNSADPETVVTQGGQAVLTFGRNNFSPRETTINRYQVADTVTWIRGAHALKSGFDLNRDKILNFFPGFFSGSYTFNSIASFNRGLPTGSGESYSQNFPGVEPAPQLRLRLERAAGLRFQRPGDPTGREDQLLIELGGAASHPQGIPIAIGAAMNCEARSEYPAPNPPLTSRE